MTVNSERTMMAETSLPVGDVELMRRIAQADREAFARLYDRYSGLLYSITLRILNDQKEAEDVIQEVFVQIWHKAGSYKVEAGKPLPWAVAMTRNKAIDRLRYLRRRFKVGDASETLDEESAAAAVFNEEIGGRENAATIRTAVNGLPLEQRQAIEMAFFGGMTQNEISESLQEPLGTVKARIRRGMLKLRGSLERLL
jgi:RNA polymerase sigma-70 factor (ECF subfamily)